MRRRKTSLLHPELRRRLASTVAVLFGLSLLYGATRNAPLVRLAAGFVALWASGELLAGRAVVVRGVAALPGAVLVAGNIGVPMHSRGQSWLVGLVFVAAAIAVGCRTDRRTRSAMRGEREPESVALLALISVGGIYACVPETGHIASLALGVGLVALLERVEPEGIRPGLAVVLVGALLWAVAYGGTYRDSAVVGGVASLGLVVVEPIARRLPGPKRGMARGSTAQLLGLVGLQGSFALAVSRTAGLAASSSEAVVIAVPMVVAVAVAARLLLGPAPAAGLQPGVGPKPAVESAPAVGAQGPVA